MRSTAVAPFGSDNGPGIEDHHENDSQRAPLCRCITSSSSWLTATGSGPPGDLALVFVALTREFVGRVELKTTFLDPMHSDPATCGPAVSGVLLGDVEDWTSGLPLDVAAKRIDPKGSNPY